MNFPQAALVSQLERIKALAVQQTKMYHLSRFLIKYCTDMSHDKLASVRRWFRTVAIDVCLLFNVTVVFSSPYFRFLFVKPKEEQN
jgi:hypothetical protein